MPKVDSKRRRGLLRHDPLHAQILDGEGKLLTGNKTCVLSPRQRKKAVEDEKLLEDTDELDVDYNTSLPFPLGKKLLKLAEEQQQCENDRGAEESSEFGVEADEDGFVVLDLEEDQEDAEFDKQRSQQLASGTANLANIVMDQLKRQTNERPTIENSLSPRVLEVYTQMAPFLARYRSGRIPKAFKIIPRLHAWEEILLLTSPTSWSKQATRAATKIFCSNLRESLAQRFLCTVLLPAVRDDIATHKKLNYHLYMALKKALFKPGAFFKGIYLPMALNGCTIREAAIVGSVVAKVSVPVLHGAAALFRLAAATPEQWIPSVSHMMTVLIDKKYSLPVQAVEECINHFHRFVGYTAKVTVAWHKCLLVLSQRYKAQFTRTQRTKLKQVLKCHFHHKIGPEIRRELDAQNSALFLEQQQRALLFSGKRRAPSD